MNEDSKQNLANIISLAEASKQTGYHQDYLGFLSRQGKLKAIKMGRNWFVAQADLDEFIKNYKNGISEVTDETGSKIKVHVDREPASVEPVSATSSAKTSGVSFISPVIAPVVPVPPSKLQLQDLKASVFNSLESRITNLHETLEHVERKIEESEKTVSEKLRNSEKFVPVQTVAVLPIETSTAPMEPVTPRAELQNKFNSNFDLAAGAVIGAEVAAASLDKNRIQKLFNSFSFQPKLNRNVVALASLIATVGFLGSVAISYFLKNPGNGQDVQTKIVYQQPNQALTSYSTTTIITGQKIVIEKNITQGSVGKVFGPDAVAIRSMIDEELNGYALAGKFQGPKGDKGDAGVNTINNINSPQGSYNPFATYTPAPSSGFGGGTSFSATYLSAQSATMGTLSAGQLTVSGNSTFNGPAAFNAAAVFNGTTTIAVLNVSNINPGFTAGSVVFQGVNGLAQDNNNLFYTASTSQLSLGTSTPAASALLQLDSTTKGFLAPRMTQAQRDAIVAPAVGLMVFNTTASQTNIWNGFSWGSVGGSSGGIATGTPGSIAYYAAAEATVSPQSVLFLAGDNIGIGSSVPTSRLTIVATSSQSNILTIASSSGATLVVVTAGGNLGIGSSSPSSALTVVGNANISGNAILGSNLTVVGTSAFATTTISQLTVTGNATTTGNAVVSGNLTVFGSTTLASLTAGNSTLGTTTASALSLAQALGITSGGTGTSTLGSAGAVAYSNGSTYGFSGVGATNQILVSNGSAAPSFANLASLISQGSNIVVTGTSTIVIAATSTPSFTTVNGLTLTSNADGFSVAGGTTARTLTVSGGSVALNNITVNGNGNLLTLFGNAALNQNLTTTSTPAFAGLTINGGLSVTGVSNLATSTITALNVSGNATTTGNQIISGNLNVGGQSTLGNASSSALTVSGNLYSGNHIVTGTLQVSATSTLATTSVAQLSINNLSTGIAHVSAAGLVSSSAINLASGDVSGVLPVVNGGTGATAFTANTLLIGNGAGAIATTTVGTALQILQSNGGSSIPTFVSIASLLTGSSNIAISGTSTIAITGVIPVSNGGIGTTTLGNLSLGSGLAFTSGDGKLSIIGTSTTIGLTSNVITSVSTGTSGNIFNISTSTNSLTINLPFASLSNTGQLQAADWTTFNNKLSGSLVANQVLYATAASSTAGSNNFIFNPTSNTLGITGSTTISNLLTVGGTLNVTGQTTLGNSSSTALSVSGPLFVSGQSTLSNASSTSLTVSGLSYFASSSITGTLSVTGSTTLSSLGSGVVRSAAGALFNGLITNADIANSSIDLTSKVTGILPVANGGTGVQSVIANDILFGNGSSPLATSSNFTFNSTTNVLAVTNASTSAATISGPLFVTGQSALATASSTALTVSGNTYLQGTSFTFASGTALSLASNLYVTGTSTLASTTATRLIVSGSTTISSLISGNVRSDASGGLFNGAIALGSADVSGILSVSNGGIGTTTLGNLSLGSGLTFTSGDGKLSIIGTSTTIGLASNVITSVSTGTAGNIFNISTSTNSLIINLPFASGVNTGQLQGSDWLTFNNKLSGSGTSGYITRYTGASTTTNSILYDTGSSIGINTTTPAATLVVQASSTNNPFVVASSSGVTLAKIDNTGNILGSSLSIYNNGNTVAATLSAINGGNGGLNLVDNIGGGNFFSIDSAIHKLSITQLAVSGSAVFSNTINVTGKTTLTNASSTSLTISGPLFVTGNSTLATTTITGSTTITSLVSGNVRSDASGNLFNGAIALGSSDVSGVLAVSNGGIGTSTLGNLTLGSGLTFTSGDGKLSIIGTSTTIGLSSNVITSVATGTAGNIFNISTSTNSLTINLPFASTVNTGQLQSADWTTFNNKLSGSGTNGYVVRYTGASTTATGVLIDNGTVAAVNASSSTVSFNIQGTGTLNPFNVASSTGTSLLTVLANGNVGIGTSTPTAKLDVNGSVRIWDQTSGTGITNLVIKSGAGQSTNPSSEWFAPNDSQQFAIYTGSGPYTGYSVAQSGYCIGGNTRCFTSTAGSELSVKPSGSESTSFLDGITQMTNVGRYAFSSNNSINTSANIDLALSRISAGKLAVGTGAQGDYSGTLIAGNIGIGTTTPGSQLTTTGTVQFSNFGTGVAHLNSVGQLSSSAIALGSADVSGILAVSNGGIGTSTLGNLSLGSGLTFTSGDGKLSLIGTSTTIGLSGSVITTVSTGTAGNIFNISTSTNSLTINLPFASTVNTGQLQSADWTTFNNKLSGSGANGYVVRYTGASTTSTGILLDNGTVAGVNATSSTVSFNVQGTTNLDPFQVTSSTGTSLVVVKANGNVGVGTTTPLALLSAQGTSGSATDLLNIATSTGLNYLQVKSGGQVNIANGTLGGTSSTDNFLNVTGTLASTTTTGMQAVRFAITSAGASAFAQNAQVIQLLPGYTGPAVTRAANFSNTAAGTGTTLATASNNGITANSGGTTAGYNIGITMSANSSSVLNLGGYSTANSSANSPALNVGFMSLGLNATTNVGGFFGLMSTAPTLGTSSALIADNGATASDIFEARNNGTVIGRFDGVGNFNLATLTPSSLVMSDANKNLQSVTLGTGLSFTGSTLNSSNAFTGSGTNGQGAYWTSATNLTSGSALLNNGTVIGINASSSTVSLNVQGTGTLDPFNISSSTGISLVVVKANGSVGIGSSTPNATLVVQGTSTSPALNLFTIASSTGAYVLTVAPSGNVGIGSSTLSGKFTVSATQGTGYLVNLAATGGVSGAQFLTMSHSQGTIYDLSTDASGNMQQSMNTVNGTNKIFFATANDSYINGGNLAIGRNTSAATLDVNVPGTVSSISNVLRLGGTNTGNNSAAGSGLGIAMQYTNANLNVRDIAGIQTTWTNATQGSEQAVLDFKVATANVVNSTTLTNVMRLTGTGLVGINTTSPTSALFVQGSAGVNPFAIASSTGNQLLTVTQAGNVGIGTTTPGQLLSVAGNMRLTGALFDANNASGTLGMVLQTTGTGTTWVATSTLGIVGITGGTNGKVAVFTSPTTLSTGDLLDNLTVSGVNATSSTVNFNIQGTTTLDPFNISSSTGTSLVVVKANGSVGIGSSTPNATLVVQGTSSQPTLTVFTVASSSGTSLLTVLANGNVGIGTSNPSSTLVVQGPQYTTTLGGSTNLINIDRNSDGTNYFRFDQSGNLSGVANIVTNANSSPNLSFGSNSSYGTNPGNTYFLFNGPVGDSSGSGNVIGIQDKIRNFNPTSGTAQAIALSAEPTINQTGTSSGISRGIQISPTLTRAVDFRALEVPAYTWTLGSTTIATAYGSLFNAPTLTTSTNTTLANAQTLTISGAPIGGSAVTITSSSALTILGGATASTTNAYGLYVNSPTGAANNYAAVFNGGNVGIGTTNPTNSLYVANGSIFAGATNGGGYDNTGSITSNTNGGVQGVFAGTNQPTVNYLMFDKDAGITLNTQGRNQSSNGSILTIQSATPLTIGNIFVLKNGTAVATSTKLVVDFNGNVGIGTSSPSQLLTVGSNNQFTVSSIGNVNIATLTALSLVVTDANKNLASSAININNIISNVSTGTAGNIFNISTSTNSLTINLPFASTVNTGQLQAADWTTFNNKLSGSGTNGYVVRYTGASTTATGVLIDNGTVAGVNATSSTVSFNIQGTTTLDPFNIASSTGISLVVVKANGSVGIGSSSPTATLTVQGTSTQPTLPVFTVASSSNTSLFIVLANGNVGIGTSSPAAALTVHYDASSTASSALFTVSSTTPVLQLGQTPIASLAANGTYLGLNAKSNFAGDYISIQKAGVNVLALHSNGTGNQSYASSLYLGGVTSSGLAISADASGSNGPQISAISGTGSMLNNGYGINITWGYIPGNSQGTQSAILFNPSIYTGTFSGTNIVGVDVAPAWNGNGASATSSWTSQFIGERIQPTFGNNTNFFNGSSTNQMIGLQVSPTINATSTSTGGYTALLVNAFEINTSTTASNYIALFQTNSSTKVSITAAGNVGIGSSTPNATLSVKGSGTTNPFTVSSSTDALLFGINTSGAALFKNLAGTAGQVLLSQGSSAAPVWNSTSTLFGTAPFVQGGNSFGATANLGTADNNPLNLITNGATALTILANGKVGIGTSNPSVALQVNGSVVFSGSSNSTSTAVDGELVYDTTAHAYKYFNSASSTFNSLGAGSITYNNTLWAQNGSNLSYTGGNVSIGSTTSLSGLFVQGSGNVNPFIVSSSTGAQIFTILANGNVGIGTSTASEKLTVNGAISFIEGANPTLTVSSGKLYASSTDHNLYYIDSNGNRNNVSQPQNLAFNFTTSAGVSGGTLVSLVNGAIQQGIGLTFGSPANSGAVVSSFGIPTALDATHFVVVYTDSGNSTKQTAVVASISGNAITYGTPVAIPNNSSSSGFNVQIMDSTHFVITFIDNANGSKETTIIGSVSGTTITFGSSVLVASSTGVGSTSSFFNTQVLDSTHFVVTFIDSTNTIKQTSVVASISGTTITMGTQVLVVSSSGVGTTSSTFNTVVLDSTHFEITYIDTTNSSKGTSVVASISGTTITMGTQVLIASSTGVGTINTTYSTQILDATHYEITFTDSTNIGKETSVVASISGTTITMGTQVVVNNGSTSASFNTVGLDSSHFVVTFIDVFNASKQTTITASVSGTTITFGTPTIVGTGSISTSFNTIKIDSTHFAVQFADTISSSVSTVIVGQVSGTTITYGNKAQYNTLTTVAGITLLDSSSGRFMVKDITGDVTIGQYSFTNNAAIGVAKAGAASGTSASVIFHGVASGVFSGLTAGTKYYASGDGTVTTTVTSNLVGVALSSTDMLISGIGNPLGSQFFGDAIFANSFRISETQTTAGQGLQFTNQLDRNILSLSEGGDLAITGNLKSQAVLSQQIYAGDINNMGPTSSLSTILASQVGLGNILQLQQNAQDRFLVASSGLVSILASSSATTDLVLRVQNSTTTVFSISVAGHVNVGQDTAGTAIIKTGDNSVTVTFSTPYDTVPKIVATVQGMPTFNYGVATKTLTSFTIQISGASTQDVSFDWIALAQPLAVHFQSRTDSTLVVQQQPANNPIITPANNPAASNSTSTPDNGGQANGGSTPPVQGPSSSSTPASGGQVAGTSTQQSAGAQPADSSSNTPAPVVSSPAPATNPDPTPAPIPTPAPAPTPPVSDTAQP